LRTLAALGLLIVAMCLGIYALQLCWVGLDPEHAGGQAILVKAIMFHGAFAFIFSLAATVTAKGWMRLAGVLPLIPVGLIAWEVYQVWFLIFPR